MRCDAGIRLWFRFERECRTGRKAYEVDEVDLRYWRYSALEDLSEWPPLGLFGSDRS
jgi:hypothetical protein